MYCTLVDKYSLNAEYFNCSSVLVHHLDAYDDFFFECLVTGSIKEQGALKWLFVQIKAASHQ